MRAPLFLSVLFLASLSPAALAREPYVPCEIAAQLDYAVYLPIATANLGGWSEAAEDDAAGHYASCWSHALSGRLARSPGLRARIVRLRGLLRQLRSQESGLAAMLSGGGTMYQHAVPRSWVDIEVFLKSLAALAGDSYGGLSAPGGASALNQLDTALAQRLRKLRAQQPGETLKLLNLTVRDYRRATDDYERTYRAVVNVVGRRPDIATLAVHRFISQPLFLGEQLSP